MSDDGGEPPRKKVRHAFDEGPDVDSEPVVVIAGESKQKFYVHEAFLRSNSGFFDVALKKEWAEGQDRIVKLLYKDPEIFKIWMKWIYTGRLFIVKQDDIKRPEDKSIRNWEWARWSATFALANFLQDLDCKDAAIDSLIDSMVDLRLYPNQLASYIYPHSARGSAHRRLAVDLFAHVWNRDQYEQDAQHLPQEFLLDVMISIGPNLSNGIKRKMRRKCLPARIASTMTMVRTSIAIRLNLLFATEGLVSIFTFRIFRGCKLTLAEQGSLETGLESQI